VPKRTRSRTRSRLQGTRPATDAAGGRASRGPAPRGFGAPRAVGAPSNSLERAAALERAYVVKDFRRIGIVVAAMLLLLVLSGFGINLFLR
jgi:hypothetical protein